MLIFLCFSSSSKILSLNTHNSIIPKFVPSLCVALFIYYNCQGNLLDSIEFLLFLKIHPLLPIVWKMKPNLCVKRSAFVIGSGIYLLCNCGIYLQFILSNSARKFYYSFPKLLSKVYLCFSNTVMLHKIKPQTSAAYNGKYLFLTHEFVYWIRHL